MISRLLFALLFFLGVATTGTAQENPQANQGDAVLHSHSTMLPMLRSEVTVRADLVTLGDLFDFAGSHAETAVFRAPAPGTRGVVDAAAIARAARAMGMEQFDLAGLTQIGVHRAGVTLSGSDLESLVRSGLSEHLDTVGTETGAPGAGFYEVAFDETPSARTVPAEVANALTVHLLVAPDRRTGRFVSSIQLPDGTQVAQVSGRASHLLNVPMLTRSIGRGEVIRADDIRMVAMPHARAIATPTVLDPAEIVGLASVRTMRPALPINPGDLKEPSLVERQDLVTLVYRQGALALSVRARALDDGAEGQAVDVTNLQSNRVVRGIVTGRGVVQVLGALDQLATLSPEIVQ
ncbi:MAG: flagellar basal body P-ring formation protein FlgA [Devosiaceae bacterium]|nr:flagellar basal body P-ring formation protein FlgA [Devosiaceae bacterium MH13]